MSRLTECRTERHLMIGAALGLAAVVIAATAWQIEPAAGQEKPIARKDTPPTVPYWHVWTDDKGVSHQKRSEMSAFKFQSISPGAAPFVKAHRPPRSHYRSNKTARQSAA